MAHILIVDDEEMDRVLLAEVLIGAGHAVTFAEGGRAALESWQEHGPDLVVTDMIMPGMDGLSLLEAIRSKDPEVPIIAISGITAAKLNKAMRSGAFAVLTKPVDPSELLKEVSRALDSDDILDIPDF